jgi:hypothetical protein
MIVTVTITTTSSLLIIFSALLYVEEFIHWQIGKSKREEEEEEEEEVEEVEEIEEMVVVEAEGMV